MDEQNKNLLLASALSFLVIIVWFMLFPPEEQVAQDPARDTVASQPVGDTPAVAADQPATGAAPAADIAAAAPEAARIAIETPRLTGSLSTLGGRIDDLKLKDYRVSLDEGADIVTLLRPTGQENAYYSVFGWAPTAGAAPADVPGPDTIWTAPDGATLSPGSPVELTWTNGGGLTFTRRIAVDDDFMFTITQSVANTGAAEATLRPYGLLRRHGEPANLKNFFILHEGLVRLSDGELEEVDYDDITKYDIDDRERTRADRIEVAENGWIGFTDHYWMTTLIPQQAAPFRSTAKYFDSRDIFQAEAVLPAQTVAPGQSVSVETRLFAGAKEWDTIREYERSGVTGFIDSIDWGWFFFLTKPIFAVLHWINATFTAMGVPGAMGWAIICLTILIKAILFPLAYKSYASMAKMKELQPEMEKIKEKAGDDRQKLQQEMMALYKKEKVNPAAGCLPILMQIPIFFSLYKVIFVTLELRHAPWIGWIRDLSAPDPSSIFNLFGLMPWAAPESGTLMATLFIGVLPILLGISMWLQQKLNPAPTDPTQQMIFAWMPWVFMFMLGSFASGLVVYWIANNMITFIQQYSIMRIHGYKPDVFGNIRATFKRKSEEKT